MLSDVEETIYKETMVEGGFVQSLESGTIDKVAFDRLIEALAEYRRTINGSNLMSRIIAACLFGLPWELENQSEHFRRRFGEELARELSTMAEQLRLKMSDMLWEGFESYYEGS